MIPYDAEKLLLFLEEEEFIVNKVKKMLYSQKVAPYVFVIPFVISLLVFWLYPLISGIVMSFQDISFGKHNISLSQFPNWPIGEVL